MLQICSEDLKKQIQTDNIYVYTVKLPPGINEAITPCSDGYTIYIDINLPDNKIEDALRHAINHINSNDFEKLNVQSIEYESHKGGIL